MKTNSITLFSLILVLSISCSKSDSTPTPSPAPPCETVQDGSGSPAATADWTYDFTTKSSLDTNIWTPEVTMSGEGNFEFEAYVNSPETIKFDSTNGLSLMADLMTNYTLQAGQKFGSVSVGSKIANEDLVVGAGRTPFVQDKINTAPSNQITFNTSNTCTDNGNAFGITTYSTCLSNSFTSVPAPPIGSSTPTAPLTKPAADGAKIPHTPETPPGVTTIIPPVISGRISMKSSKKPASGYDISQGFRYGRIEIVAKTPKGDWLWPAMWMMPKNVDSGTGLPANYTYTTPPHEPKNGNNGTYSLKPREPIGLSNPAGMGYYGLWPRSGEIDILESRGNSASCSEKFINGLIDGTLTDKVDKNAAFGGVQSYASTLHWGPNYLENAFAKTHTEYYTDKGYSSTTPVTTATLDQDFHTYGLRWSPKGIYTYIDNDSNHVLEVSFESKGFFKRGTEQTSVCLQKYALESGKKPTGSCQNTLTEDAKKWMRNDQEDPWNQKTCHTNAAPFDRHFYLILNVAIGGTAGEGTTAYFPDGWCTKPWHNPTAPNDFWSYPVANFYTAKDAGNAFSGTGYGGWNSTWTGGSPSLQVKTIKYWTEENAGAFGQLGPDAS